jgi:ZIP family zinc transporter
METASSLSRRTSGPREHLVGGLGLGLGLGEGSGSPRGSAAAGGDEHKSGTVKVRLVRSSSEQSLIQSSQSRAALRMALSVGALVLTAHAVSVLYGVAAGESGAYRLDQRPEREQLLVVWSAGWLTAASTGLGALPFLFMSKPGPQAVGCCNAIAAGMMSAASIGLIVEGCLGVSAPGAVLLAPVRVLVGLYLGVGLVKLTERVFGTQDKGPEDMLESDGGVNPRRAFVIMAVMTLHSFSEGIGIGVSFHSQALGAFVTATLAVHNVPEGLAIAIVLMPRGFSRLSTTLWCVFSSLPQPIMAVPAYFFVQHFLFLLPIGLGLAAGAMGVVVFDELLPEALEALPPAKAYAIAAASMLLMASAQFLLRSHDGLA